MKTVRIIPRLDIKGPNLVKGIHLEGLRVLGKPEDFAKRYYEDGADELLYMDVVASLYNRNSLHDIIRKTARQLFIPLTVGGGLRTIDDIRDVLRAGADKVSINTAAVKNPTIISDAANMFGSSTITISIEAMKQQDGKYLAFTDNGREFTGLEVVGWAKEVEQLGAGEITITSIDREGTGEGFDTELTSQVARSVSIPVVASGGAGSVGHVVDVIHAGNASAVAIASILHYGCLGKFSKTFEEGNVEFLKNPKIVSKIKITTIPEIKKQVKKAGIPCRF